MSSNSDSDSFANFNNSKSSNDTLELLSFAISFRQRISLLSTLKTRALKLATFLLFYVQLKIKTQAKRIKYIFDVIEAASQSLAIKLQG
jgi:hypothetical protein